MSTNYRKVQSREKLSEQSALDDEQLVQRVQGGEFKAFNDLQRRHERVVYRTARHILSNDADAWDASQQAFLNAFRGLRSFRGQSSFKTWLLKIVVRVALKSQQKKSSRRRREEIAADHRPTVERRTPLHKLLDEEQRELITRFLQDHATLRMRFVWKLHTGEGLTYPKIARKIGSTVHAPRNVIRKLRAKLRKHLTRLESSVP